MQVSESLHRKHFDMDLKHIYQLSISALFDVIEDKVKEEKVPGALYHKTHAAVLQEKGVLNESDKNSHKDFLRSVPIATTQPEIETNIWKVFNKAELTEEEIFVMVVVKGISFNKSDYVHWKTKNKDLMDLLYKERISLGVLKWTINQVSVKLEKKSPAVFAIKNSATKKIRKLANGDRYI